MDTISQVQTVSNIEDMQELQQTIKENPGILRQFLNSLPQKALNLGIRILIVAIVFIIGVKLIKFVRKLLRNALLKTGTSKNAVNFMDTCLKWLLYILLILGILTNFGLEATSIVAFIGSLGVTIGLALQGSLSNLAGGVLLLIMKPFKAGDYIKECSKDISGTVTEVQIFYTKIHTDNNYVAMIPNGTLANNTIINYSAMNSRMLIMTFSISYSSDLLKAKEIILNAIKNDIDYNINQTAEPYIYVKELAEDSVIIGARAWTKTDSYLNFMKCTWRINEAVKAAFDDAGIVIPFPQLEIHEKSN